MAGDHRTYWILLGVQTLGAGILYWFGVPLYRRVIEDPAAHVAQLKVFLWAVPSITLMQVGYWWSFRIRPPLPQFVQPFIGHVVLCVTRFAFVLVSGVFSLVLLAPKPGFHIPIGRYVLTIAGLFALFCYTLELERFGRALLGSAPGNRDISKVSEAQ
jgi:hypothetical protein